jgi:hypothetical protein
MALKQSVAELGAIGRNLNQLTRLAHQGMPGPTLGDLVATLKACEALRDHTHGAIVQRHRDRALSITGREFLNLLQVWSERR